MRVQAEPRKPTAFSDRCPEPSADITLPTAIGTGATRLADRFGFLAPLSSLQVATSPQLASTISVDGVAGDNKGVDIALAPGAHQVCFAPVARHSAPPCQRVMTTVRSPTTVTVSFDATPATATTATGP